MTKWLILLLVILTPIFALGDCHKAFERIASTLMTKPNIKFAQRMKSSYRRFRDSEFSLVDYEFFHNINWERNARHDLNRAIILGVCEKRGSRYKLLKGAENPLDGKHRTIISAVIPESIYSSLMRLMQARSSRHFERPFSFRQYLEHSLHNREITMKYARRATIKDLELGADFGLINAVDDTGAYQFDPRFEIPPPVKDGYQKFVLRSMATTGETLTAADHNFANRIKAAHSYFSDGYFTTIEYEIFNGINRSTVEHDLSRALTRGICIRDINGYKLLAGAANPFAVNDRPIVSAIINEMIFHTFERLTLLRSSGKLNGEFSFKEFEGHSATSPVITARDLTLGADLGMLKISTSQRPDSVFLYHFNLDFEVPPSFRAALEEFKARSIAVTENALTASNSQFFERIIKAHRYFKGKHFSLDDYKSYIGVSTTRARRDLNRAIARGTSRQDGRGFELLEEAADPSIVHPVTSPYIPMSIFSAYEILQLARKSGDFDGVFAIGDLVNFAAIVREIASRNLELGADLGLLRMNRGPHGSLVYQFNPSFEVPPLIKAGYREIPKETFVFTKNVITDGDIHFASRVQRAYFNFGDRYFSILEYMRFHGIGEDTAGHDINRAILRKTCTRDRRGYRFLNSARGPLAERNDPVSFPVVTRAIRNSIRHLLRAKASVNIGEAFTLRDFSDFVHLGISAARRVVELGVDMGMLKVGKRGSAGELIYQFDLKFVVPGQLRGR